MHILLLLSKQKVLSKHNIVTRASLLKKKKRELLLSLVPLSSFSPNIGAAFVCTGSCSKFLTSKKKVEENRLLEDFMQSFWKYAALLNQINGYQFVFYNVSSSVPQHHSPPLSLCPCSYTHDWFSVLFSTPFVFLNLAFKRCCSALHFTWEISLRSLHSYSDRNLISLAVFLLQDTIMKHLHMKVPLCNAI